MSVEPEITAGRRAYPKAQELLDSTLLRPAPDLRVCGWHGTSVHPEDGAFALVNADVAALEVYVGEVVRVRYGDRSCVAYVIGSRVLPWDVSLTRRGYMALAPLWAESLAVNVEVLS